ncbi:hypothetical protein [Streptomyces botrytidirepellens]|uniref:DUF1648 domain-containing protein n=1 Tax=Streptomyces botrytidirepellens TaxID=2486417 RepID=A0A3M8W4S2_9ACTN|nr:hypothetical protein [Streptomyces botrytidirepellens]RNG25108.1 hypothetical protein EEJ42_16705 [Streptomyces botrytidirepellens]
MTRSWWRAGVVALPFLLAWAAVLAVFAALRDRLPDPVATHIGPGGQADGFTGLGAFLPVATTLLLLPGLIASAVAYRSGTALGAQRTLVAAGYGTAAMLGYDLVALLGANAGAARAAQVGFPLWHLAVSLAVAGAVGSAGWLLAGRDAAPADEADEAAAGPRLPLAQGETAVWTRSVGSPVLVVVGAGIALLGVALTVITDVTAESALIVGGLISLALSRCRVTVDRRGLSVAPWFAPRPRMRIPLERIAEATSREARALGLGGWGYRLQPGRSSLVLRSGDALFLRLVTGKEFVVTVDDAATAAALLNTLVERGPTATGARG